MKPVLIYGVETNTDLTEGRGYQYIKYFCSHKSTAKRMAKGVDVQGSDARVVEVEALEINDTLFVSRAVIYYPTEEDLKQNKKQQAIERAKALGLSDDDIQLLENG